MLNFSLSILSNIDALLVTNPKNIFYLSGFQGLTPHERESYLFVTQTKMYLMTNALYLEQAKKIIKDNKEIELVEITSASPLTVRLIELINALGLKKIGFESEDLKFQEYTKITADLSPAICCPTSQLVEQLRLIKTPLEITKLQKACTITDACFTYLQSFIKPQMTEADIAWEIESYFKKNGAQSSFPPIVAFNINSSQPHYSSSMNYKLRTTDFILLDFGAKFQGYCADMTRMIFVGNGDPEISRAYKVLKTAQQKALDLLTSGERSGSNLDQAVRDELATQGFPPYPHSLGHAVGLDIHEAPRLSVRRDETLKPGMVFSVEPGIYVEGKFGLRIEDLVLIKENGIEVLSTSPKNLIII